MDASAEDRLRALEDREALVELNHKLCHLIDTFDLQRMVDEVFTEDGSDDHGQGPVVGRDAILAWYQDSTRNVAAIAHNIANVMVELDGDRAVMRSNVISWTWTVEAADDDPMHTVDYALSVRYEDVAVRTVDGWRIQSRTLLPNVSKTPYPTIVALGTLPSSQRGVQALARKASIAPE